MRSARLHSSGQPISQIRLDSYAGTIRVGEWRATRISGELSGHGERERLEPKVMDLLFLLASRAPEVVGKEEILQCLWPRMLVGEDTLARAVSKLRKALRDDAKSPRYIETVPKRGYRLLVSAEVGECDTAPSIPPAVEGNPAVSPIGHDEHDPAFTTPAPPERRSITAFRLAAAGACAILAVTSLTWLGISAHKSGHSVLRATTERADDYYYQFSRADNEAAIALYERIIATDHRYSPAYAGLANALVQKVIRWPSKLGSGAAEYSSLRDALRAGHARTPDSRAMLQRAQELAELAISMNPEDASAHKSLGSVFAAEENFAGALAEYHRAVQLNANAWGALFEIGDVLEIERDDREALGYFEAAYAAMTRTYEWQTTQIRPWYADIAVLIGDRYRTRGDLKQAQKWYRQVLEYAPLHRGAIHRLADTLFQSGDQQGARNLCAGLELRVGPSSECAAYRGNTS
jgi:transcriptional activator of cad operon